MKDVQLLNRMATTKEERGRLWEVATKINILTTISEHLKIEDMVGGVEMLFVFADIHQTVKYVAIRCRQELKEYSTLELAR